MSVRMGSINIQKLLDEGGLSAGGKPSEKTPNSFMGSDGLNTISLVAGSQLVFIVSQR